MKMAEIFFTWYFIIRHWCLWFSFSENTPLWTSCLWL